MQLTNQAFTQLQKLRPSVEILSSAALLSDYARKALETRQDLIKVFEWVREDFFNQNIVKKGMSLFAQNS